MNKLFVFIFLINASSFAEKKLNNYRLMYLAVKSRYKELKNEHDQLKNERDQLKNERDQLKNGSNLLCRNHLSLLDAYQKSNAYNSEAVQNLSRANRKICCLKSTLYISAIWHLYSAISGWLNT